MAVGAVSYHLDHPVVGRLVRYTYGTPASTKFDPTDTEHRERTPKMFLGITGQLQLDVFSPTLFKVINQFLLLKPRTKSIPRARELRVLRSSARRLLGLAHSLLSPAKS